MFVDGNQEGFWVIWISSLLQKRGEKINKLFNTLINLFNITLLLRNYAQDQTEHRTKE